MDIRLLKESILFSNMTVQDIEAALSYLNTYQRSYRKGEALLHAGSSTRFLGIICKGKVLVERNDLWGNRTVLTSFEEGAFFAEAYAMNPDAVIPVDIVAIEETSVFYLEIAKLSSYERNTPHVIHQLTANLLRISLQKNIYLSNRSFLLATRSMRDKILGYLNGVALQNKSHSFDLPFDRQQLADFLNIERTALSKELGKMKKEGLIEFKKNHFTLANMEEFM